MKHKLEDFLKKLTKTIQNIQKTHTYTDTKHTHTHTFVLLRWKSKHTVNHIMIHPILLIYLLTFLPLNFYYNLDLIRQPLLYLFNSI